MSEENINGVNEVVDTVNTAATLNTETVSTEVQQAPVYVSDAGNTEPPKKKHKGLKIALIAIAAVVLILGIAFVILYTTNKEYVQNKWALLTKNDEDYFKWVVEKKTQNTKSAMLT
ncbi:MAG: hypothetical protein IKO54_01975, partial [Lachnospiraceae bacterium]|nr:hypothetical protein [Lachnospiraceae bacterium]